MLTKEAIMETKILARQGLIIRAIGSVNILSHFFLGGFPVPGHATE